MTGHTLYLDRSVGASLAILGGDSIAPPGSALVRCLPACLLEAFCREGDQVQHTIGGEWRAGGRPPLGYIHVPIGIFCHTEKHWMPTPSRRRADSILSSARLPWAGTRLGKQRIAMVRFLVNLLKTCTVEQRPNPAHSFSMRSGVPGARSHREASHSFETLDGDRRSFLSASLNSMMTPVSWKTLRSLPVPPHEGQYCSLATHPLLGAIMLPITRP